MTSTVARCQEHMIFKVDTNILMLFENRTGCDYGSKEES